MGVHRGHRYAQGATKQVIVYRLKTPENGPVYRTEGTVQTSDKSTENGPVKEAQKRNSSENGTGPIFPHNRPVFPTKEAQNSRETGPKTGPGTVMEPSKEPSGNRQLAPVAPEPEFQPLKALLENGVREQIAKDWLKIRKAKKAPLTLTALDGIREEAAKVGLTLPQAIKIACESGWQGFKAEWVKPAQHGQTNGRQPAQPNSTQLQADNDEAYRLLFGKKQSEVIDV
jgi:hypothetical protein